MMNYPLLPSEQQTAAETPGLIEAAMWKSLLDALKASGAEMLTPEEAALLEDIKHAITGRPYESTLKARFRAFITKVTRVPLDAAIGYSVLVGMFDEPV